MERLSTFAWPRHRANPTAVGQSARILERFVAIGVLATLAIASGIWNTDAHDPTETARDAARADAQSAAAASVPTREIMIGAYGGMPYTYNSDVSVKQPGVHDFTVKNVEWRGEPFIDPIYYGVRVQKWFEGGRTGSMLDFTHSKTIAELKNELEMKGTLNGTPIPQSAQLKDVFRRLEFSHGHNMLTMNGLMRLANLHPHVSPYVGIGVGINLPHSEIQLQKDRARTYEYQFTGPVLQALIGLELRVPRMSYFVEYKFTFASYHVPLTHLDGTKIGLFADLFRQASRWWSGESPPGGFAQTQLTSHQLIGGLGVRFATHAAPLAP